MRSKTVSVASAFEFPRQQLADVLLFLTIDDGYEDAGQVPGKGLYMLAREGKIKEFTGISDTYDVPENPELSVETETVEVDNCAQSVTLKLESMGVIKG